MLAHLLVHTAETSTAPPFPRSSFSFSVLEPGVCLILKPRAPVSGGCLCHQHQRQQENRGRQPIFVRIQLMLVSSSLLCSSPFCVHLPFLTTLGTASSLSRVWDPDLTCHSFYNRSVKSLQDILNWGQFWSPWEFGDLWRCFWSSWQKGGGERGIEGC